MNAEILTVGTELLLGQIVDTNSATIAERLAEAGIDLYCKTTVGDNLGRIVSALRQALARADAVIVTGGLGPTEDDLTREGISEALGISLCLDPAIVERIRARFAARGATMTENNKKQALVPEGGEAIPNPRGTAPGLFVPAGDGKVVVAMPGVPGEMRPMLLEQVIPRLRQRFGIRSRIRSRVLKTCGVSESRLDEAIGDLFRTMQNPTIGVLAHAGEIHVRLTAKAEDDATMADLLGGLEAKIRERLGDLIFGRDEETLEAVVGGLLRGRGLTLAVAESATGGLLAHRITNVPGSSQYFLRGIVAYTAEAKAEVLGVPRDLLAREGPVSREVTEAMAAGVRASARAHFGIGITGVAGPGGGTAAHPVGLHYIALAWEGGGLCREFRSLAEREANKIRTTQMALEFLRRHLLGAPLPAPA